MRRTGRARESRFPLREFQKPKPEKKHRGFWYLAFGLLFARTEEALYNNITGLLTGTFNPNQFGAHVLSTLKPAHTQGYVIGASSVGGTIVPADAEPYIEEVMKGQSRYLEGFIEQLEDRDPKYVKTLEELYPELVERENKIREKEGLDLISPENGVMPPQEQWHIVIPDPIKEGVDEYWDEKNIQWRMRLYNERIRGTANWGAIDMLAPWEEIRWVLGPNENHCEDCPRLAKGIYRKNTLPTTPGSGGTECQTLCKCHLELADGTLIQF